MSAFYFGCWSPGKIGHYLYDVTGRNAERSAEKLLPIRFSSLDGGLLNGVPDAEGSAVLFHGRGWTFLSFWDRSGDRRPGSSSTFLMEGLMYPGNGINFGNIVDRAKEFFPKRWELIKFSVTEYPIEK